MNSAAQALTLEAFLSLPAIEESPAWELIHGELVQKPLPTTHHSILQKRLELRLIKLRASMKRFLNCAVCSVNSPWFLMLP